MKVKRETLLDALQFAQLGLSTRGETLEQSNAFVFQDGCLITFNDEMLTRQPSPLGDLKAAVLAAEFQSLVAKLPDEELEVELKGEEVVLTGAKRSAGIAAFSKVLLPFDAVPQPEKWFKLGDKAFEMLQQAARTCDQAATMELTGLVHATPKLVEACDNFRLFRADTETGFPAEVLIPAGSLIKLQPWVITAVSVGEGWVHFRTDTKKLTVSVRCSHEKYHESMDALLQLGKDAQEVSLPANLGEIVERANVMQGENPKAEVKIEGDQLTLTSRKDTGWYTETKKVKYSGKPLSFEVHPQFLVEVLARTRKVMVDRKRMKLEADGIQFVVSLQFE